MVLATVAMLLLVVLGVMVVTTMATMPMEDASTQATSVVMAALLQATMVMVAMEVLPLVVSLSCICMLTSSNRHSTRMAVGCGNFGRLTQ